MCNKMIDNDDRRKEEWTKGQEVFSWQLVSQNLLNTSVRIVFPLFISFSLSISSSLLNHNRIEKSFEEKKIVEETFKYIIS